MELPYTSTLLLLHTRIFSTKQQVISLCNFSELSNEQLFTL
ncbi:hypothetical protein COO91_10120 (plasmid) [Nostoc flagelliforme CCNUN1]|uniref:Uncharacterized protein n=1 Tax=Nostoc flagelliforme CCNUN1 TaxID=2038116 RepID=A0A2K8T8C4_9NOSO|nr:hypothetical protein COO91_10120 [Nostoc flagelliforme CCNUN1]